MYEDFFGLNEKAFSKTPDPRFLYLSDAHQEALAQLEFAVEEKEIALLTGEIGCGKTLLSRALMDRLAEEEFVIANVINPGLRATAFLRLIAQELGIPEPARSKREVVDQLQERFLELHEASRTPVVLIDESQLIPGKDVFDEIRLLTNFQLDSENLVSIVLLGQPELLRRLRRAAYRPLTQRIGADFHLTALSAEDTDAYLAHRLTVAGARQTIFTPEAAEAVHKYASGIPRSINNLATQCLLEGLASEEPILSAPLVERVARSMRFL